MHNKRINFSRPADAVSPDGVVNIDADPNVFEILLNWLRRKKLMMTDGISLDSVAAEAEFFGLIDLKDVVEKQKKKIKEKEEEQKREINEKQRRKEEKEEKWRKEDKVEKFDDKEEQRRWRLEDKAEQRRIREEQQRKEEAILNPLLNQFM